MANSDVSTCKSSDKISEPTLECVPGCDSALRQIVEKAVGIEAGFKQAVGGSSVFGEGEIEGGIPSKDLDLLSRLCITSEKEKENSSPVPHSSLQTVSEGCVRRKLLVLDVNGLLVDMVFHMPSPSPEDRKADAEILGRAVFERPYCSEFLKFCCERFDVAIWSSRSKYVIKLMDCFQ